MNGDGDVDRKKGGKREGEKNRCHFIEEVGKDELTIHTKSRCSICKREHTWQTAPPSKLYALHIIHTNCIIFI